MSIALSTFIPLPRKLNEYIDISRRYSKHFIPLPRKLNEYIDISRRYLKHFR